MNLGIPSSRLFKIKCHPPCLLYLSALGTVMSPNIILPAVVLSSWIETYFLKPSNDLGTRPHLCICEDIFMFTIENGNVMEETFRNPESAKTVNA